MIKDIVLSQKLEMESTLTERYIKRDIDAAKLSHPLIKVIIGPRRAGKSFFALHALERGFGYVNFDDERLVAAENYDEIVSAAKAVYNNPKTILFDEIQNLPKWELFVNRLQRLGCNLVITGSNSKMLSKELATHLTGRHMPIYMLPFSFREYIEAAKQEAGRELTTAEIKERLSDYVVVGGYPEPLTKKMEYKNYLSTLFDSVVYKDIVKRHNIRSAREIDDMAYYILSNVCSEQSFNSLAKVTMVKNSRTVQKYLDFLEEAFVFFCLPRFSYKVKEQISSNKKVYCFDNGFVHAKAFSVSSNIGKLYENAVACELKKEEMNGEIKLFYWKNIQQEEVDFVVKRGTNAAQLIQVCSNIEQEKTKEREIRALLKASGELKCKNLIVITQDYDAEEKREWFGQKGKIKFVPLYKWLLERKVQFE